MKVLMILTSRFHHSGITMVVLNYYKELIKKDECYIDFIVPNEIDDDLLENFDKSKTNYYVLPMKLRRRRVFSYYKQLKNIMKQGKYDIVHVHGSSSIMAIELKAAKKVGIKGIVAHSHNTKTEHPFIHKLFYPSFNKSYNYALACSDEAGKWLFKNNSFEVITNGFNISRFKYDEEKRNQIRIQLGIKENEFVLGHIGLFNNQKNQIYLIKIMDELLKTKTNVKLLLVGKGDLKQSIIDYAKEKCVDDKIIFYGETSTPEYLYSAMDMFLMPSKYEGLGIVAIEAQISNLPCIISNNVPKIVKVNDDVVFLPIDDNSINEWCNVISKNINSKRKGLSDKEINKFNMYNIKNCVDKLYEVYLKLK